LRSAPGLFKGTDSRKCLAPVSTCFRTSPASARLRLSGPRSAWRLFLRFRPFIF
jgi:hypothetical protein